MRLIGTVHTEKEAFAFYAFLLKEGVPSLYEPAPNTREYCVWVYEEDDVERALEWFEEFKKAPEEARFQEGISATKPLPPTPDYQQVSETEDEKWSSPAVKVHPPRRSFFLLMKLVVFTCILLFLWNDKEESTIEEAKGKIAAQIVMTPLQQEMLFDLPASYRYVEELIDTVPLEGIEDLKELPPEGEKLLKEAEEAPAWRGLFVFFKEVREKGWTEASSVPMFEKIREGEFWRLFSPCLMHRDFLHILFNMIWAWILLKQVEARLRWFKIVALILIIGVVSNVAQYLMGGPYFLGFSGVIVGLAAFIWTRQKKAPWEGYTLPRSTVMFLLFFVLAMFAIEIFSLLLQWFASVHVVPYIANTAHIVGGLTGLLLGRITFFGRRVS